MPKTAEILTLVELVVEVRQMVSIVDNLDQFSIHVSSSMPPRNLSVCPLKEKKNVK